MNGAAGPGGDGTGTVELRRVRKAYEQVADQLRELILSGEIRPGDRLPNEAMLAAQMGVSRATIREALRSLSAQSLIRTTKGATGGSFVSLPSADHIAALAGSGISLLTRAGSISLDEFLELRDLLEVPAARLAARRRTSAGVERIERAIPPAVRGLAAGEQLAHACEFHAAVTAACANTLLLIAARPMLSVLATQLRQAPPGQRFLRRVRDDHRAIATAIAAGDEGGAAAEMRRHLEFVRPAHRRAWRAPGTA